MNAKEGDQILKSFVTINHVMPRCHVEETAKPKRRASKHLQNSMFQYQKYIHE